MKFSESWLRATLDIDAPLADICERLTEAGLELESVETLDADPLVELSITPNRADCLSMRGIAREVAALYHLPLPEKETPSPSVSSKTTLSPSILDKSGAHAYHLCTLENINNSGEAPQWMRDRLASAGVRSVDPVVDTLNYVMMDCGQPLHAFDRDTLKGELSVRFAHPGEKIHLIDGQEKSLSDDTLVIADAEKVVAIAGVMGSLDTAVSAKTQHIVVESAHFVPTVIANKARFYTLNSDAAYRFERGIDPTLPEEALHKAIAQLLDIVGGNASDVFSAQGAPLSATDGIVLRFARLNQLLGQNIAPEQVAKHLQALGATLEATQEGYVVFAPSWRLDWAIEEDLIEEVVRMVGLSEIQPTALPMFPIQAVSETHLAKDALKQALILRDYREVITYSFVQESWDNALMPTTPCAVLMNPISQDKSHMRTTLWSSLLPIVQQNQRRQLTRVRIMETGLTFQGVPGAWIQTPTIAGVVAGQAYPEGWGQSKRDVDFFDVKADVEALLSLTRKAGQFAFERAEHPALHPGQSAAIHLNDHVVGWVGALHPSLLDTFELDGPVYLFECDLAALTVREKPHVKIPSKYPSIRRDIALQVPAQTEVALLRDAAQQTFSEWLLDCCVFDIYQGPGIPDGEKSVALGLTLQAASRTLIDSEVDEKLADLLARLKDSCDATLRE